MYEDKMLNEQRASHVANRQSSKAKSKTNKTNSIK